MRTNLPIQAFRYQTVAGNLSPISFDGVAVTPEDRALIGFLPFASDGDGDFIAYAKASDPVWGSVSVTASGAYTYTPSLNFNGSDSFRFAVSDDKGGSNTYTQRLTITAIDDTYRGGEGVDVLSLQFLPSQYAFAAGALSGPWGRDNLSAIENARFGAAWGAAFTSDVPLVDLMDPDGAGSQVSAATATLQQISDLYVAYFNRAPDVPGLLYWFAEIASGRWEIDQVASSFTDQPEYWQAYPEGLSDSDFITAIYRNLFDREPDAPGFAYWSDELARGMARDTFILTVIRGAYAVTGGSQDKALLNHKHAASLYYSEQLALHPGKAFDLAIDQVLNRVDYLAASVTNAEKVIDYLMNNEVTLTGLSQDVALWDSFWA